MDSNPSDAVILERARSLAKEAIWAVAPQRRRLCATEPEDEAFVFLWWDEALDQALDALRRRLPQSTLPRYVHVKKSGHGSTNSPPFPTGFRARAAALASGCRVYGIVVNVTTLWRPVWTKQSRPRTPIAGSRNYCEPLRKAEASS